MGLCRERLKGGAIEKRAQHSTSAERGSLANCDFSEPTHGAKTGRNLHKQHSFFDAHALGGLALRILGAAAGSNPVQLAARLLLRTSMPRLRKIDWTFGAEAGRTHRSESGYSGHARTL
jgi:hypothetical protein